MGRTFYFFNVKNQNKNLDENILQCAVLSTFYTAFDVALNAMCIDNKKKKHKTTLRIVVAQITLKSEKSVIFEKQ